MNPLDYFFYRVYAWKHKKNPDEMDCFMFTWMFFNMLVGLNVFTLNGFFTRKGIMIDYLKPTINVIIFAVILFASSFFYFFLNKRYKKIERKYSLESEKQKKIGGISIVIYLALSVVLFVARV